MNIKIKKLHSSKVRDEAVKDSLLHNKYDICLIAISDENYAVYHREKLHECYRRDFSDENIINSNNNISNYACIFESPTEKLEDLTECCQKGYWFGIPSPIICEDNKYLQRQEDQEFGTLDIFGYNCEICVCGQRGCVH